jgi:catechol 2,3-dioxygenase-like lactoylglutathione lyase family enzyme
MIFEFSPHIAFQVKDYDKAIEFYEKTLGMKVLEKTENETAFRSGPLTFYVENTPKGNTFFEFSVQDLESARNLLVEQGCILKETVTPEGDKSYFVFDPYGMKFHLFQK